MNDPFVYVSLSSQATGTPAGWLTTSAVYPTPAAAGAQVPRASKLQAPVAGAILSGVTYFQWECCNLGLDYRLEIGTAPGTANIYNGPPSTNSAVYINIPATGGLIYVTVYTRFTSGTLAETAVYAAQSQGQTVPYQAIPAQVISIGQSINNPQTATVQWNSGAGADCYWLSLGTAVNTTNLFDQRGECTNQRAATIPTLTTTGATLQPTLYSRINNVWYPAATVQLPTTSLATTIPASFYACVSATGTGSVCQLPAGTHRIGPADNPPISIRRGNILVRGVLQAGQRQTLILRATAVELLPAPPPVGQPANPPTGCEEMITIKGVSNVTVRDLKIDGGGTAFPKFCRLTLEDQPVTSDLHISGDPNSATQGTVVDNILFLNAIGRALTIYGNNHPADLQQQISGVYVYNSEFVDAQLTGILVGTTGAFREYAPPSTEPLHEEYQGQRADLDYRCDAAAASRNSAGAFDLTVMRNATNATRVPRNIVITNNIFRRHWTGTVALNEAVDSEIANNQFFDNYNERSWDGGGGTILDGSCALANDWHDNYFDNSGIEPTVITGTFELRGRHTKIRNNTILNQVEHGVDMLSCMFMQVTGNIIRDVSRRPSADGSQDAAPVKMANLAGGRLTTDILVSQNIMENQSPERYARYGLRIGGCTAAGGPTLDDPTIYECKPTNTLYNLNVIAPPTQIQNTFINFTRKPKPMCLAPATASIPAIPTTGTLLENCDDNQ